MSDRSELKEMLEIADCELLTDQMFDDYGMIRSSERRVPTRYFTVGRIADNPRGYASPILHVEFQMFGGIDACLLVCGQLLGRNEYAQVNVDRKAREKLFDFLCKVLEPAWWQERLKDTGLGHDVAVRIGKGERVDDAASFALELQTLFHRYQVHARGPLVLEPGAPPAKLPF